MTTTDMKGSSNDSRAEAGDSTTIRSTCSRDSLVVGDTLVTNMANDVGQIWRSESVFL